MDNPNLLAARHKGIVIEHLNIRSLWNKIDLFRSTFLANTFSVIGLSETWLTQQYTNSILNLDGYNLYRLDRHFLTENNLIKKGGGVCLYV